MARLIARANEDRAQLGIALMLAANFGFALVDSSVKWLVLAGLPAWQLAFMRYFGHVLISTTIILKGGFEMDRFRTDHAGLVILRALFLVVGTVMNFFVLRYLSLTVTSAIMFSAPIIVCALAGPTLGERAGPVRWAAILLGFAGVLVIIRPFGAEFHWAYIVPLLVAVCMACYSLLTRHLSGKVATDTMQFYSGAVGSVILLPAALLTWQTPQTVLDWMLMLMLGVWAFIGHEWLTRAHGFAPANLLMPYTYSFMVYLTIISVLVFGDLPDFWTIIGAMIIVVSGLIIWMRERQKEARG